MLYETAMNETTKKERNGRLTKNAKPETISLNKLLISSALKRWMAVVCFLFLSIRC